MTFVKFNLELDMYDDVKESALLKNISVNDLKT